MVCLNHFFLLFMLTFVCFINGFFGPDRVAWSAMRNLYITPLSVSHDIATKDECSYQTSISCLLTSFEYSHCFANIYNYRISDNDKTETKEKQFLSHLKKCSTNQIKNLPLKNTALSLPTHQSGGIQANFVEFSNYPFCYANISQCLHERKCTVQYEYNIFDKIINTCSEETFTKMNITFAPSESAVTTYIDDLIELSTTKIGPVKDSYTTNLSQETLEIFGNLAYEELDAIKVIATTSPFLKQFLCDSKEDRRMVQTFEKIERSIVSKPSIDTPQIPENVKKLSKTFTQDIYEAVKAVLKVHPHFRWLVCSSIFAITESKDLTNVFSADNLLFFG